MSEAPAQDALRQDAASSRTVKSWDFRVPQTGIGVDLDEVERGQTRRQAKTYEASHQGSWICEMAPTEGQWRPQNPQRTSSRHCIDL